MSISVYFIQTNTTKLTIKNKYEHDGKTLNVHIVTFMKQNNMEAREHT